MALIWADFPSGDPGAYGGVSARMSDGLYADVAGLIEDPHPTITGYVLNLGFNQVNRFILPAARNVMGGALRYWCSGFDVVQQTLTVD